MREPNAPRANGYAVSRDLNARLVPVVSLSPLGREARKHPPAQVRKLARSLEEWGFVLPIVIDANNRVVAGWGLVEAAKKLDLTDVPAVTVTDLSEAQLKALRLSLNRLGEDSHWDQRELAVELAGIIELEPELDLTLTGFEIGEIDVALQGDFDDEEDEMPGVDDAAATVTKPGDRWICGGHVIACGDARDVAVYERLLGDERAELVITDPPYNVAIPGHVSGNGVVKHEDFRMASGEMSPEAFIDFLKATLGTAADHSVDGAIHFVFMDWRHQRELLATSEEVYSELKNLCVWTKTNAGMGSLYRSQHELVYVFKKGTGPHINNVQLGRNGRNRTNVWTYPSQNALNGTAKSKLALHPTAKPVGLVADAIRDCSNRGGIVLDPFGGIGTTMIAAEKAGRRARLIEIEPRFVDASIR